MIFRYPLSSNPPSDFLMAYRELYHRGRDRLHWTLFANAMGFKADSDFNQHSVGHLMPALN